MTKYVLANWKSHKTMPEAEKWMENFCNFYRPAPQVKVIIAPSFIYIARLWEMLQGQVIANLFLAIQNLSPFPLGAYTGAVAAEMVRGLVGIKWWGRQA